MNIAVIGTSEAIIGFALTGIKNLHEVATSEDAWNAYEKENASIIILSAEVSEMIDLKRKDDRIIVKVSSAALQEDDLSKIVKDAIGFEMSVE